MNIWSSTYDNHTIVIWLYDHQQLIIFLGKQALLIRWQKMFNRWTYNVHLMIITWSSHDHMIVDSLILNKQLLVTLVILFAWLALCLIWWQVAIGLILSLKRHLVWFDHSRDAWSDLDTREALGLIWSLERRLVWFVSLERCKRLRDFICHEIVWFC